MVIYCISGLGADHRAFINLRPSAHQLIHLPWPPIDNSNSIAEYAQLFIPKINTEEPFALVGLSFGGMVALELAKHIQPKYLFIISSIISSYELPWHFRLGGKLGLQYILPKFSFAKNNFFTRYYLGVKTNEAKDIYQLIIKNADPAYYKKAIQLILQWKPESNPANIRIHGSNDKLLPVKKEKVDHYIKSGGHLMIIDKGKEISNIINSTIK